MKSDKEIQALLRKLIKEHPTHDMSSLSRMLGRHATYIHGFVSKGSPDKLHPDDRRKLANALGVDERELGAPMSVIASYLDSKPFDRRIFELALRMAAEQYLTENDMVLLDGDAASIVAEAIVRYDMIAGIELKKRSKDAMK